MKAIEWFFQHWVLYVLISYSCNMVTAFKSVDESLVCDHSNESYWSALVCGAVYISKD